MKELSRTPAFGDKHAHLSGFSIRNERRRSGPGRLLVRGLLFGRRGTGVRLIARDGVDEEVELVRLGERTDNVLPGERAALGRVGLDERAGCNLGDENCRPER